MDEVVPHTSLQAVKTEDGVGANASQTGRSFKVMRVVPGRSAPHDGFGHFDDELNYSVMTIAEIITVTKKLTAELSCRLCPKGCVGRRTLAIDDQRRRRRRRAVEVRRPRGQFGVN